MAIGDETPDCIVCVDESAVNILTTFHMNGQSYAGLHACKCGIIYSHIKVGNYNDDQFIKYLQGLLNIMNSYPQPHSVLVMDNCSIHNVDGVEELCTEQ
ncbi:hypothetical protein PAXRUDRAFT_789410 [Paxillus rubicundulus Ve08.2h10]|uniref:Tc1-like transposase DDE domain-containing protein n=1 Tax=Paxillus rubicundulus Ve08.2h10 TaxID=930991 RepID=A0A0D0E0A6_9AGAM|nr:hypothetical protein PAXRUDRAFT_789410 [Paxillus rubicundulus Ve08.2h10]